MRFTHFNPVSLTLASDKSTALPFFAHSYYNLKCLLVLRSYVVIGGI